MALISFQIGSNPLPSYEILDFHKIFNYTLTSINSIQQWINSLTLSETIIGIIGIILTSLVLITQVLIPLIQFIYNRKRNLNAYFKIIWKNSSSLKPSDVLEFRGHPDHGFTDYYYDRDTDRLILERIRNGKNILVIGNPLSGKTRAIYQALIHLKRSDVLIPKLRDVDAENFQIPLHIRPWRKRIILLDDIDKFTDHQHFNYMLGECESIRNNLAIVASCKSGPEYDKICLKLDSKVGDIFGEPIEIPKISRDEGKEISTKVGKNLPSKFDGNIGSIFLEIETMKDRFRNVFADSILTPLYKRTPIRF